jgi:hypothetical protein
MAYTITPIIGPDVTNTILATDIASGARTVPLAIGTQAWGSDGKQYVFAKANASISASTAVCTVSATTFLATASGGSYTSPATAMVTGDYGWFSKASV